MASSVAARGKIHRAQEKGEPIPLGWAVDENGSPTTDPHAALKGMFLPIGGPKGFGLALMIDVLAGMLSGSNYGPKVKRFHHMLGPTGVGAFMMALDPQRFMPLGQFKALMKSYRESIKGVKRAQGVSEIYLPGEIEFYKERQSLTEGVEIDSKIMESLKGLLKKYSVSTNLR